MYVGLLNFKTFIQNIPYFFLKPAIIARVKYANVRNPNKKITNKWINNLKRWFDGAKSMEKIITFCLFSRIF